MKFTETTLKGVFLIEPTPIKDGRGSFARVFCAQSFREQGLIDAFAQVNHATTVAAGTIRGLHYQVPPTAEVKFVRCLKGEVFDVAVDVRCGSPTFLQWYGVRLSPQNQKMLYVPKGFAHGYQALTDHTEVTYQSSSPYSPQHERQLRFDEPRVGIDWAMEACCLSDKDHSTPFLTDDFAGIESL